MTRVFAAAVVAVSLAGCNHSPQGGAPGTDQTFRITTGPGNTHLKPGESKTVTLTVRRDSSFTQPVTLKAESQSPKVTATINKARMEASDSEVTLTVQAAADAPKGEHVIKVTGAPQSGQPASLDVKVEVDNP